MNVLVIGCGRLGSELAHRLFRQGHQVTVVDATADAFANLPGDFRGRLLEGEVLARDLLERARIQDAEAVAVVTSSDAVNAVVGHVARTVYGVPNVAVRNYDPRRRPTQEAFDLPLVSSSLWGAWRFEEMLTYPDVRAVHSMGNGEVAVYEVAIPDAWSGQTVGAFLADAELLPTALVRQGHARLPTDEMILDSGDRLHMSGSPAGARALQARLARRREA